MKYFKLLLLFIIWGFAGSGYAAGKQLDTLYFYGNTGNDLYKLLRNEGFTVKIFSDPLATIQAAPKGSAVFLIAATYRERDPQMQITTAMLNQSSAKNLRLYIECPASYPDLDIAAKPVETTLERGVVTTDIFGGSLEPMSLLGIHDCFLWPSNAKNSLIVMAKVAGVDKAKYGLTHTVVYPLLSKEGKNFVAFGGLSNFEKGR